jgi:hypothetical protein
LNIINSSNNNAEVSEIKVAHFPLSGVKHHQSNKRTLATRVSSTFKINSCYYDMIQNIVESGVKYQ